MIANGIAWLLIPGALAFNVAGALTLGWAIGRLNGNRQATQQMDRTAQDPAWVDRFIEQVQQSQEQS